MENITTKEVQKLQLELMKQLHVFLEKNEIDYYLIAGSALGAQRHKGFIPWDDDIDIGIMRKDYEKLLSIIGDFSNIYDIKNWHNFKYCDYCLTRIYFPNIYIKNDSIKNTKLEQRLYMDIFPLDNIIDDAIEQEKLEEKLNKYKKILSYVDCKNYNNTKGQLMLKKILSLVLGPCRQYLLKKIEKTMRKYENDETNYVCSMCSQYSFNKQLMNKAYYGKPTLHKFETEEFYLPERIDDYLATLYGPNYMEVPDASHRRKESKFYKL